MENKKVTFFIFLMENKKVLINKYLAIALPSLRISPLLFRIITIVLLYTAALFFSVVYIQSIGSGIGVFSELRFPFLDFSVGPFLLSCVLPGKPCKSTREEQDSFLLSEDLKQKLGFEKQISDTWLQWFIGLTEGVGAILSYKGQPQFVITQKEGQILYEIQSVLGFGTVRYFSVGEGFYRYIVTDTKSILLLCLLFNGNLVLSHRVEQLGQWIIDLNAKLTTPRSRIYQLIPLITAMTDTTEPSLKNAWLSGFTDAEGTFNVNITERLNTVSGFRVQLRFLLDQNNAYDTFMYIRDLFGSGKVTHRGETKNVYRLTINTFTGLSSVCAYFLSFPLKTKKGVSFTNWYHIYNMVINKEHLSKEGLERVRSISKNINSDE
jgi:hypothetical protein